MPGPDMLSFLSNERRFEYILNTDPGYLATRIKITTQCWELFKLLATKLGIFQELK